MNRRDFLGAIGTGVLAGVPHPFVPSPMLWRGGRAERFVERWSWAMGQAVHLQLFATSEEEGLAGAAAALAELRRVESCLSRFDDASDLSELNRCAGRSPLRVDRDLAAVLRKAARLRAITGGAFDIAVEPLMRTWGFRAGEPRKAEPGAREIAEAREAVAAAVVRLDGDLAWLPNGHTQLDLGGIGVGYGLDRAVEVLRARGIRRALLDVSGDSVALGAPPGEAGWLVGIADSARPGAAVASTRLRDEALATSANTVAVVRFGRAVRGHVMDPATGRPAARLRQATVVAPTAVLADALSTAMVVTGVPAEGVLRSFTA